MPSLSLYFLINERQLSSWSFGFNQHQQWNIYLPKKNTFHAPFDHVAHMHRHQLPKARSEAAERFASTAALCDPPSACSAEITCAWHRPSLLILAELQGAKKLG